ncbi:uncharacterized protein PHACADRAFT_261948 [Phanerochaete carnosa HHB-10118-sp]|uniref:Peptidase A1 domain-containing protein n=1 Tax=Phanerochaete carnosa (strain HHB-10118-sp) TaxID=650164 RepID=K5UPG6_PHACS|nr:uncharacterized protein PHACADRAFT_261948 [Phanerochaete carnosa HHB-10118-sp]EKM51671.1 hypothetical protein PHACADRAFT_261948 [Phanerochaete carnosa HHB-10118-sp]
MLSRPPTSFLAIVFASLSVAHALNLDIRVRSTFSQHALYARDNNSIIPVANTRNAEYIANITLGGREIPVLLDTGSSDLWVTGQVPNTTDLGKSVSVSYAVGQASGDVNAADLVFAGYQVSQQAYLLVNDTASFSVNIESEGFEGLIGLGPNSGSVILDKLDSDSGNSILNRIFSQNTTSANYLTLLLGRESPVNQSFTGQLTISEIVPGFEQIEQMPKLTVETVERLTDEDQHWQTYTDANGVIGPDGQPIAVDSIVPKAPDNQLIVVFDSGYTLPQVPRAMSDMIYGRVQGAQYDETAGVWLVPCDQLLNLSFMFGGVEYPIHPLDLVSSDFNMVDATGNPICVGTFQPITTAFSLLGEYDIILGMAFLRNTYTLFDYGDWVEESSNDREDPYIQLLSITNKTQAHEEFVQVRMNGVDTSNSTSEQLLPVSEMQHSPVSAAEKKQMYEEEVLSRWPEILVGCLAFVLIVIGIITWRCCVARRRRRARQAQQAAAMGINAKASPDQPTYKIISAQSSNVDMHEMSMKSPYDSPYEYKANEV